MLIITSTLLVTQQIPVGKKGDVLRIHSLPPPSINTKYLSSDQVKQVIKDLDIMYPVITYSMYREESGNGKSNLAKNHCNIMGMKYPKQRETLAIGKTKSGFAIYKSQIDCLRDFKLWQSTTVHMNHKTNRKVYLKYIRRVYANGDKNYLKKYLGY